MVRKFVHQVGYIYKNEPKDMSVWGEVKVTFSCLCFNCKEEYMYLWVIFVLVIILMMM